MNFASKHKFTVVTLVIILIMIILGSIISYKMFFSYGNNKYGSRLKNVENLEISNYTVTKLESELKELENVDSVNYNLNGKIINVMLKVDSSLDKDTAKEYGDKVLEYFSLEERKNYDIQVFVETKEDGYSIIGYVKAGKESLVWSNN
jgi:hypothetical protein